MVIYDSREEGYQGLNSIKQMRPLPALILLPRNFRAIFKASESDRWTSRLRSGNFACLRTVWNIKELYFSWDLLPTFNPFIFNLVCTF